MAVTESAELPGPYYRDAVVFLCRCGKAPELCAVEGGPDAECCHCGRTYRRRLAGSLVEVCRNETCGETKRT